MVGRKKKENVFISGVYQTLINKEDLLATIKDDRKGEAPFDTHLGRRNVGNRSGKMTVRSPIVDLLLGEYKQRVSQTHGAFANSRRDKDIRLKKATCTFATVFDDPCKVIRQGAKKQKKLNMRLEHGVVREKVNLDIKLK